MPDFQQWGVLRGPTLPGGQGLQSPSAEHQMATRFVLPNGWVRHFGECRFGENMLLPTGEDMREGKDIMGCLWWSEVGKLSCTVYLSFWETLANHPKLQNCACFHFLNISMSDLQGPVSYLLCANISIWFHINIRLYVYICISHLCIAFSIFISILPDCTQFLVLVAL